MDDISVRPSRRKLMLAMGVIAALVVAAWFGLRWYRRAEARDAARRHWASLSMCLLGEPLAPNETMSARLRNVFLATPAAAPGTPRDPASWPDRCSAYSRKLAQAGRDLGDTGLEELADAASLLLDHEPERLERLADAIRSRGLDRGSPQADVPRPVTPARPVPGDALDVLGDEYYLEGTTWAVTGRPTFLLQGRGERRRLCAYVPGDAAGLGELVCRDLAESIPWPTGANVALIPSEEGVRPLINMFLQGERTGLYDALSGKRLVAGPILDGFGQKDGTVLALVPGGERSTELIRMASGGAISKAELEHARVQVARPWLAGDWLLWLERHEQGLVLLGRPVSQGAVAVRIGRIARTELTNMTRPAETCRAGDTWVVAVQGPDETAVFFRHADGWSGPFVTAEAILGRGLLTCGDREAVFTWLGSADDESAERVVYRVRCSPDGCKTATTTLQGLGREAVAIDLGGSVLVAWVPRDIAGQGSVRARVAPIDKLAAATDIVLLDDSLHGGISAVQGRAFPAGTQGIILVHDRGYRPLAITAAGQFGPIPVRIEKP